MLKQQINNSNTNTEEIQVLKSQLNEKEYLFDEQNKMFSELISKTENVNDLLTKQIVLKEEAYTREKESSAQLEQA